MLVSAVQPSESAICVHCALPLEPASCPHAHPLWLVMGHRAEPLCYPVLPTICFTRGRVCLWVLFSQFIPPAPSPPSLVHTDISPVTSLPLCLWSCAGNPLFILQVTPLILIRKFQIDSFIGHLSERGWNYKEALICRRQGQMTTLGNCSNSGVWV